jgi:hypothetical protein
MMGLDRHCGQGKANPYRAARQAIDEWRVGIDPDTWLAVTCIERESDEVTFCSLIFG